MPRLLPARSGDDLGADARVVTTEMGDELRSGPRTPHQLEPMQHRDTVVIGIALGSMRPKTFSGHDIFKSIAVYVQQVEGVQFRKAHAVFIGDALLFRAENDVLFEAAFAIGANLFIPPQPKSMRVLAGDDVVQSVAV